MLPLPTLLQSLVAALAVGRAALLLLGHPLSEPVQLGLLLTCALYAAGWAYWTWTMRPRLPRGQATLRWGETRAREQAL